MTTSTHFIGSRLSIAAPSCRAGRTYFGGRPEDWGTDDSAAEGRCEGGCGGGFSSTATGMPDAALASEMALSTDSSTTPRPPLTSEATLQR